MSEMRIDRAMERIAELEKALEPFAKFGGGFGDYGRENSWVLAESPSHKLIITMGDVRAARDALATAKPAKGE